MTEISVTKNAVLQTVSSDEEEESQQQFLGLLQFNTALFPLTAVVHRQAT